MTLRRAVFGLSLLALAYAPQVQAGIEPTAGKWRTWVISSGRAYRVPPPPGAAATRAELRQLASIAAGRDAADRQQIRYWDAGSPAYRWIDFINARGLAGQPTPPRMYMYVALAMNDATIAAWESKYFYNRPRPSQLDHNLPTALPVPDSPSYPSEHAAAAFAAAAVLAYFLPAQAQTIEGLAEDAGWSRVLAGLQYPSDYKAGMDLGRRIGAAVIARAQSDGSDATWDGVMPSGPCVWRGTNPGNVTARYWKPLLLESADQFRPPPPPDCHSPEVAAQLAEIHTYPRNATDFVHQYKAFYWQSPDGLNVWVYRLADKWMAEDKLDRNPPRAARVYALLAAVTYDTFIASQDGKFTYWYLRPPMLDPSIVPPFPVPNFPSYPSNHSSLSAARSEVLAYLFPTRAEEARAIGKEAGDSRIWAGIHYQMDNLAGVQMGKSVAGVFIEWARADGSR